VRLHDTDLFCEAPLMAHDLWEVGYRPVPASQVQAGMTVVYFETDVFGLEAKPIPLNGRVRRVSFIDPEEVLIEHTGGDTLADYEQEVWVK